MTIFPVRATVFGAFLAAGLSFVSATSAQQETDEEPDPQQETGGVPSATEPQARKQLPLTPLLRRGAMPEAETRADRFVGPWASPDIERDPARRAPRSIAPQPYATPGSIRPVLRERPITDTDRQPASEEAEEAARLADGLATGPAISVSADGLTDDQDVIVGELTTIDPGGIGLLGAEDGGFGRWIWHGADPEIVRTYLYRLPVATPSPSQNALSRRLLLSRSEAPAGIVGEDFLTERLLRIAAAGDLEGLLRLLDLVPSDYDTLEIRRLRAEAALLGGDHLQACSVGRNTAVLDGGLFWVRLGTFCEAIEGDRPSAMLYLELMAEEGAVDATFTRLIGVLLDQATALGRAEINTLDASGALLEVPADALSIAMARLAGRSFATRVSNADRLTLGLLATLPELDPSARLDVAKRAVELGVIGPQTLARVWLGQSDRADVGGFADTEAGVQSAALIDARLLEQSAFGAEEDRIVAFRLLFERLRGENLEAAVAPALSAPLALLQPKPYLSGLAGDAGRIHLLAGRADLAQGWYNLLLGYAHFDDAALVSLNALWPIMVAADSSGNFLYTPELAENWARNFSKDRETRDTRIELAFDIFAALGYERPQSYIEDPPAAEFFGDALLVPETAEESEVGAEPKVFAGEDGMSVTETRIAESNEPIGLPEGLWQRLQEAVFYRQIGETVLLSQVALSDLGLHTSDPAIVSGVIEALRRVGLREDAHRLAVEALVAYGF